MTKRTNSEGYEYINLWLNRKRTNKSVHRLIAITFLPNPNNLPQINHKDENKANNCVDNLEWRDCKYNLSYGSRKDGSVKWISKPVAQYDALWNKVSEYSSATAAAKAIGIALSAVAACCRKTTYTAHGFHFQYINDVPRINARRV
jgi:hypothetical protein